MSKKPSDKKEKVGEVKSTSRARSVARTEQVEGVEQVESTSAVLGVGGVKGIGKTGSVKALSIDQRDRILSLITEEADRLAKEGAIPKSQRAVVEQAVKMVIDAAMLDMDGNPKKGK